jgi:hypothetical protein
LLHRCQTIKIKESIGYNGAKVTSAYTHVRSLS